MPVDLEAALVSEDWRQDFIWPVPHALARNLDEGPDEKFTAALRDDSNELLRDIILHAAPVIWMTGLGLLEMALIVQNSQKLGLPLEGGPAEAYFMQDIPVPDDIKFTAPLGLLPAPIPNAFFRRIARTKSWTAPLHLPGAMMFPESVAITHNSLLVAEAGRTPERIGFHHANSFLQDWDGAAVSEPLMQDLMARLLSISSIFSEHPALEADMAKRVTDRFPITLKPAAERSAKAILGMRARRKFPDSIWAGTGGYFPARAIRIETRRRGGSVTGFDHGGTSGLVDEPFANLLLELSVSNRFVTQTKTSANAIRDCAGDRVDLFGGCEIAGGTGDPAFRATDDTGPKLTASGTPRVLYVTGPFVGPLQRAQPRMPDVMKMDWQLRLVESLRRMPIDLICQPHPEGALRGRPHPIGRIAELSGRRFEEIVDWADVIVTDMVLSTTLWKSACRDIPIVLIDLDNCDLNPALMPIIENRFRILRTSYDERNRPIIDEEALADTILRPRNAKEDPAPFRRVLAGD